MEALARFAHEEASTARYRTLMGPSNQLYSFQEGKRAPTEAERRCARGTHLLDLCLELKDGLLKVQHGRHLGLLLGRAKFRDKACKPLPSADLGPLLVVANLRREEAKVNNGEPLVSVRAGDIFRTFNCTML